MVENIILPRPNYLPTWMLERNNVVLVAWLRSVSCTQGFSRLEGHDKLCPSYRKLDGTRETISEDTEKAS